MKTKTLLPALALLTLLLAACSGVMDSAQPARQYYMLVPYTGSAGASNPSTGPVLSVAVSAVPGLDSNRVQALSSDARLSPYANARWPDHLPEVLSSVIQRSLASTGRFTAVENSSRASGDGWLLNLEVRQFYGIRSGSGNTSSVIVEIGGSIECGDQHGSFTLSDTNSVADEHLSAVVSAHQKGLNEVTRQLVEQINKTCS